MKCNAVRKWTKDSDIGLFIFYDDVMNERFVAVGTVTGSRIYVVPFLSRDMIWVPLHYAVPDGYAATGHIFFWPDLKTLNRYDVFQGCGSSCRTWKMYGIFGVLPSGHSVDCFGFFFVDRPRRLSEVLCAVVAHYIRSSLWTVSGFCVRLKWCCPVLGNITLSGFLHWRWFVI